MSRGPVAGCQIERYRQCSYVERLGDMIDETLIELDGERATVPVGTHIPLLALDAMLRMTPEAPYHRLLQCVTRSIDQLDGSSPYATGVVGDTMREVADALARALEQSE